MPQKPDLRFEFRTEGWQDEQASTLEFVPWLVAGVGPLLYRERERERVERK